MARTVAPGRIPVRIPNDRKRGLVEAPQLDFVGGRAKRRRLVLARGNVGNVVHFPTTYYGYLARAEGGPRGPWQLHFEATDSFWMSVAASALGDQHDRLRRVLGNHTFDDVFDNGSIAQRVVLRHIANRFWAYADIFAPPLALIGIELNSEELSHFNQPRMLAVGRWYWLETRVIPDGHEGCFVATRRDVDAQTLEIDEPEDVELVSLESLQLEAPQPGTRAPRLSQAEIEALHFPM